MVVKAFGILRGTKIELQAPVDELPDGSAVALELRPRELPISEKRRLVEGLAGRWANDPSLEGVFAEIEAGRRQPSREVDFDGTP